MSANASLFDLSPLDAALADLKRDLMAPGGPAISTIQNYRFAILVYGPKDEFRLRTAINRMSGDLRNADWDVLSISLQTLLLNRIRAMGEEWLESRIARERSLSGRNPDRHLNFLINEIAPKLEGEGGIADDVASRIDAFADQGLDPNRTVIFIGRAGALYPFHRSSALLKLLDGRTRNLPVVLLYPGHRGDGNALSFMGRVPADRDYRPRIYS